MSIAQKYLATIATVAVAVAVVFSFVATIQVAQAATVCPHTFSTNLKMGSRGTEVMALQQFLNSDSATMVASTGAGSPGMETSYLGAATKAAIIKFQNKYATDVLAPNGLTVGNGNFFASSRAKANALCTGSVVTPTPTPATGTGLAVNAGTQPANSLAPKGATRVPYTRFTLTAGNDGDVVVNGVTVQKDGLGQDAAFQGVVLVDESTGAQVGVAKTFNSNHQTVIGGNFTVPRGTTKTYLIAGNMNTSLTSYTGEAPGIALVAVNTTATVSGSLPIVGAHNTNNDTLNVGTIGLDVSNSFASNSNQTKEIGTTAYKFTGFRLTAGSAEDVRLKTVTFNQSGSVSSSDLANVMVNVAGTNYPTTLSSDGRYYTANLGSGVVIGKGNQVDVYISADIIGSNSSGRTVIFDVDKTTDIFGTGETYGYGISPTTSGGSAVPAARTTTGLTTETTGTPYVYAAQVTVSGASITQIGKANEVPAQNVAINLSNQPLGGYVVDMKGEAITVQSQVFTVASTTGSGTGLLTNVTLVDENGLVVAGPVDATYTSALVQTVTFSDTVTYKTGRHVYTLKGKVASTIGNGGTYIVSTTPSSGWTTVRGETSGNTISLSGNGAFSMNTMTVKSGAMTVGRATSPASQAITPGASQLLFVNLQFDASQSGEDVRFSSIPATLTAATGVVTELTSCAVYDGTTQLTTGSNTVNPSGTTSYTGTFTLDTPVTVAKGTVKTLGIRCNVSGSATDTGTFSWNDTGVSNFTFSGATSGTTITNTTDASDTAVTMTVGTGSATVTIDASSPNYKLAASGSTDVTVGVIKFRASKEDLNLRKVGLTLTNTASSSSADLVKVSLYDGATKVGEAYFTGSGTTATSTLTTTVTLAKNTDKALTIKADLSDIGVGNAVTFSGHLLAVDFLNAEASGVSSGTTIYPTGTPTTSGVRIFKSMPTVALESGASALSSTGLQDGRLMRFKVTADAKGPVGITQFVINLATTTASVTNIDIRGFQNSDYTSPISGVSSDGSLLATASSSAPTGGNVIIPVQTSAGVATAIQIPAGTTRYFEVYGTISGDATGASVTTKLLGDSAYHSTDSSATSNSLANAASTTLSAKYFIWSPNSTTTSARADQDWTEGYGVSGLPAGGLLTSRGH